MSDGVLERQDASIRSAAYQLMSTTTIPIFGSSMFTLSYQSILLV